MKPLSQAIQEAKDYIDGAKHTDHNVSDHFKNITDIFKETAENTKPGPFIIDPMFGRIKEEDATTIRKHWAYYISCWVTNY